MDLETPVERLFMIGPIHAKRLAKIGLKTAGDLLYYFPFRYIDYTLISPIALIQPGETVTIQGELTEIKNVYTSHGKKIQKAVVRDQSGSGQIVWFNQPFLVKTFKKGIRYRFSGKVDWFDRKISLISPEYEGLSEWPAATGRNKCIHTGRLVPVYHETAGLSSKWLRSKISAVLEKILPDLNDYLPEEILRRYHLFKLPTALRYIHFPSNLKEAEAARRRFAFEELFLIHLNTLQRKIIWKKQKSTFKLPIGEENLRGFLKSLPFILTKSQKKALGQILSDLARPRPMNRLLEGDVGSGKTVVAAGAIFAAYVNKVQSALMAPTEILAHQHYQTLKLLLNPLGVKISLITGTHKKAPKDDRPPDLIIGTHALLYQTAQFTKLGLVIIDEQHRFGVEQRSRLIQRGLSPHVLTMTATPIPRTIALTLYGDLDLSCITEMIPGRKKVKTWVVPDYKRNAAYQWIKNKIKADNEGCFIVCPLIERSETLLTVRAAVSEFERLKNEVFPDLRLGLLHGRLKASEKEAVIRQFKEGTLDILVSTPVVEVGIDIPRATIMVIEAAERFGLAQLHQLRGRVGRADKESFCLLFTDDPTKESLERLKAMEKIYIGMELAELDLKLRGPGEIYGTAQHGFFDLKIASFSDLPLIEETKRAALAVIPNLNQYPYLKDKIKKATIRPLEPN